MRFLVPAALIAALAGCATTRPPATSTPPPSTVPAPTATVVPERFVSVESPDDELDSPATWSTEDGRTWVIVTAKSTHRLVVYDGDSGERLSEVGSRGTAPGQFNRPNGVAVHGDFVFVVERDNHRVQVLSLPDFKSVATFGDTDLRSPYGLWIHEVEPGDLDVYVTDNFMDGAKFDVVPPLPQLAQRVKRFRVDVDGPDRVHARLVGSFGDTTDAASLHIVESIAGDPANDRLLVADEDTARPSTLREYGFDGRYTGRSTASGTFTAQAEGVALWTCDADVGYWVGVDQLAPHTVFHVFDRTTLAPVGSFEGRTTSHTDGISLYAAATPSFPHGVMYAVHDDRAITAFDLRDVATALHLSERCAQ
ncbi:phytase [Lysobacter sp. TY2-98]|uniref:phytase n=1 Tax=Lysobacter sp. TY2-98 TaxID=2290922 RepID=UPI000E1FCEDF|nr:phytase [Lysobacter sp. TY2-98]AXK71361.1 phytase [Lysobacter sp. TY2-98]